MISSQRIATSCPRPPHPRVDTSQWSQPGPNPAHVGQGRCQRPAHAGGSSGAAGNPAQRLARPRSAPPALRRYRAGRRRSRGLVVPAHAWLIPNFATRRACRTQRRATPCPPQDTPSSASTPAGRWPAAEAEAPDPTSGGQTRAAPKAVRGGLALRMHLRLEPRAPSRAAPHPNDESGRTRPMYRRTVFVLAIVTLMLAGAAGCTTYPGGPGSPSDRLATSSDIFMPPPSWE